MSPRETTTITSAPHDTREAVQQQAEQAQRDAEAQREREQQAREDDARLAAERARMAADAAQSSADQLAERADAVAAEADDDGLDEIDMGQRVHTVRIMGGGVRRYGPGKVRVPRSVADAIKNAPTFATSGDRLTDALVRRRLERDHGVEELTTTDESTARAAFGSEEHTNGGASDDDPNAGKDGSDVGGRRGTRSSRSKTSDPLTKSELQALGAEEVERRYDRAVKAGRVRPIADGKGSGAEGNVITEDRVDALVAAGETK